MIKNRWVEGGAGAEGHPKKGLSQRLANFVTDSQR